MTGGRVVLVVVVMVMAVGATNAAVIGRPAFSGKAVTETFENIKPVGNPRSITVPTPFLLPCGVTITDPVPNRGDSFGTKIVDGGGFFGYSFDTLAPFMPSGSAYVGQANAGLFDEAVTTVKQAIAIAPEGARQTYQVRLEIYQQGQPFRTTPLNDIRPVSHQE